MSTTPQQGASNRNRRRLLISLLAPLLGLVLVELVVRGLDMQVTPVHAAAADLFAPVDDPELLFVHRRTGTKSMTYSAGERQWTAKMKLNGQRFRGPVVGESKLPNTLRIACLGDSHTFGDGVQEGEPWPAVLRERCAGEVEVINAGVNAYDTLQEALWYERFVERFDPDLVLLQYFANDVAARGFGGQEEHDLLTSWTHPKRRDWLYDLRQQSRAADVICDRIYNSRSLQARQSSWDARYVDGDPGWERAQAALLRLRERCTSQGRSFAVVLFPYMTLKGASFASHDAFRVVSEFCMRNGIECFDGEPALLAELDGNDSAAELRVAPSDFHANARAYRAFADALHLWLAETALLSLRGLNRDGSADSPGR